MVTDSKNPLINFTGYISYPKTSGLWYLACPDPKCLKKVDPGDTQCPAGHVFSTVGAPTMRYTLSFQLCDSVSALWVSVFDEVGRSLLKLSAEQLSKQLAEQPDSLNEVFNPIRLIPYQFRIRAKKSTAPISDTNTTRINYSVQSITPVDFAKESQFLLEEIARYGFDPNAM